MTKNTKLGNDDNGVVLTAEEAILSGVASNRPQDICTKYPEKCTELQVAADDCTICCDTVKPEIDDCAEHKEKLLYRLTADAYYINDNAKVRFDIRMYNPSDVAITNIRVNVVASVNCYVPEIGPGSTLVTPGKREWLWTVDSLAPHSEVFLKITTRYKGYAICMRNIVDAPAELTEDSVLYCKHIK